MARVTLRLSEDHTGLIGKTILIVKLLKQAKLTLPPSPKTKAAALKRCKATEW